MSSKMTKCKTCQTEIATGAKTCPQCGAKNKKSIAKKWWFWALIVVVLIAVFSSTGSEEIQNGDYSFSSGTSNTEETTKEKQTTEKETTIDEETSTEKSVVSDEISPAYFYQVVAETNDPPFTVSDKALAFINEHENFFPGNSSIRGAISDYVDNEITFGHLTKNISKYGDKLISVYGTVIDIYEDDEVPYTYIHILDDNNKSYVLYYYGILDDVLENSYVSAYALPLTITTFENMQAEYTEAVLCAASYVEVI